MTYYVSRASLWEPTHAAVKPRVRHNRATGWYEVSTPGQGTHAYRTWITAVNAR